MARVKVGNRVIDRVRELHPELGRELDTVERFSKRVFDVDGVPRRFVIAPVVVTLRSEDDGEIEKQSKLVWQKNGNVYIKNG